MLTTQFDKFCLAALLIACCSTTGKAASSPDEVALTASTIDSGSPFKLSVTKINLPDNEHFAPVPLRPDAPLRGFSLSGLADLKQTDGAGSSLIGNKTAGWQARYRLHSGCVLLTAQDNLLIDAGPAKAFIGNGTTAVVHTTPQATRLVNLTDHKRYSMRVIFGKHYIDLDPGFELVLVPQQGRNPKDLAIQEDIGWKDMRSISTDDTCVFVFRVRAADMLKKCHIYRQLNESPLAIDHHLRDELVKSVAALEVMFNKHTGPFAVDTAYGYGSEGKAREDSYR